MNVKEAREIWFKHRSMTANCHCANTDQTCSQYEGFLEGYAQASKAAEPLLVEMRNTVEILGFIKEADLLPMAFAMEDGKEIRDVAVEAIFACARVVENYKKEVLGE